MAHNILLEAGTNEMEMLVFRVGTGIYGINVAKVRELVQRIPTVHVPNSPPAIEGSFKLREEVLTLVNLGNYLKVSNDTSVDGLIIIIELNQTRCGILVDAVEMIHRLHWNQVEPPCGFLAEFGTPITATAKVGDRVVLILDFETILGELLGANLLSDVKEETITKQIATQEAKPEDARILVADDSLLVRQTVERVLQMAGFKEVVLANDGEDAWQKLVPTKEAGAARFDLVLSDIEMPRVDGLHLTLRIKKDPDLAATPVVLFSSIISDDTVNKGNSVGADAQVAKSDTDGLVAALRECLKKGLQNK